MGGNPLRELLNRLRWEAGGHGEHVTVAVTSREGRDARAESIGFSSVTDIGPSGLTVADGTFLPYHRVIEVRRGDEVLWRSRGEETS